VRFSLPTNFSLPSLATSLASLLPRYIERGGTQDIKNPFRLKDVALDAFFFRADYRALFRLVERDLDRVLARAERASPLRPSFRVVPLAPFAMFVCAQAARIEVPGVGYVPEVDVAFWVPVLVLRKIGPFRIPHSIAFYQPYLFVDSGQAMATGRETYGYHKMIGDFDLPTDPAHVERIETRAIAWRRFGVGEKAEKQRVFTLREKSGATPSPGGFTSIEELIERVIAEIADDGNELTVKAINQVVDLLELLGRTKIEQVFLKQFRSIEDPSRACYQAVAKVGSPLRHFHRGGLLLGDFELDLADLASLPIRSDLGLDEGVLSPFLSLFAVIDFDLDRGATLGRA